MRLVLFIDAQNTYMGARECFFSITDPHVFGQFDPVKLGALVASRGGPGGTACTLTQVRLYTGRPDSSRDPKTYGAHMKQCAAWSKAGATVVWRALRYPRDWPNRRAEEKGIDVALAIDYVAMAVDGLYDVGVIMSTDTDLVPALEAVIALQGSPFPRCEVAAWSTRGSYSQRLGVPGRRVWCHWLDEGDYRAIADPRDFSKPW